MSLEDRLVRRVRRYQADLAAIDERLAEARGTVAALEVERQMLTNSAPDGDLQLAYELLRKRGFLASEEAPAEDPGRA